MGDVASHGGRASARASRETAPAPALSHMLESPSLGSRRKYRRIGPVPSLASTRERAPGTLVVWCREAFRGGAGVAGASSVPADVAAEGAWAEPLMAVKLATGCQGRLGPSFQQQWRLIIGLRRQLPVLVRQVFRNWMRWRGQRRPAARKRRADCDSGNVVRTPGGVDGRPTGRCWRRADAMDRFRRAGIAMRSTIRIPRRRGLRLRARSSGFLHDVDQFDAGFFWRYTAREAVSMWIRSIDWCWRWRGRRGEGRGSQPGALNEWSTVCSVG